MYTDMDSILYENARAIPANAAKRWISRVNTAVLTREDLCLLYGCWADDAAAELLDPLEGVDRKFYAYAA